MTQPPAKQPAAPGVTPCAECKDNKRCLEFGQCLAAYAHSLAAWQNALPPPAILGVTKEVEDALNECLGAAVMAARWPDYNAKADAARASLLAAIEKYGDEQRKLGRLDVVRGMEMQL